MIKMKAWASSFFFFGIDIGYHNASSKSMSFARNRIDRSSVNTRHVNACITFAYARMQAINASSSPGKTGTRDKYFPRLSLIEHPLVRMQVT